VFIRRGDKITPVSGTIDTERETATIRVRDLRFGATG
jgi:hypothetical protein